MKETKKQKKTSGPLTDISVVLDKSGSMEILKADTIGGFNEFITTQKKAKGTARVTLTQFDTTVHETYNGIPLEEVQPLTEGTYVPGGGTALLDAVSRSISLAAMRQAKEKAGLVVFLIMTDGQENSSREAKLFDLKAAIESRTAEGWEFIFIGADQNAWDQAGAIGLNRNQTLSFSGISTRSVYDTVSSKVAAYRNSYDENTQKADSSGLTFTGAERAAVESSSTGGG